MYFFRVATFTSRWIHFRKGPLHPVSGCYRNVIIQLNIAGLIRGPWEENVQLALLHAINENTPRINPLP